MKEAVNLLFVLGCLALLAQPVLAIGYFASDASAIEELWQGYAEKSPDAVAAIVAMSEGSETTSQKEILSKFRILPFLGIQTGLTPKQNIYNVSDFPSRQGATILTAQQRAVWKYSSALKNQAEALITDWHEYEVLLLRKSQSKSDKDRLEEVRAKLVALSGEESVKQAESKVLLYSSIEIDLINKSQPGKFPYYAYP